jgi:hypothetical protein
VIRQICPHCFGTVELAESTAGTTVNCTLCQKSFPVPGSYTPTVASAEKQAEAAPKPAPPPGLIIPTNTPAAPSTPKDTTYGHAWSVSLSPAILDWLPVAGFTVIFLLTLFSWVGLYPNGIATYTQSPWQALRGSFDSNFVAEDVLKLETPLKKLIGSNFLILFPYLISVLIAMILGWADRVVTTAHVTSLPGPLKFIETIWPHRFAVLTGLAVLTLGLLLLQLSMGFGLDRAITEHVSGEFTEQLAATDLTDAAKQKIAISKGTALAKYRPETTTWLGIVVWLHILVILATAARAWLYRRGDKPLPKLTLQA